MGNIIKDEQKSNKVQHISSINFYSDTQTHKHSHVCRQKQACILFSVASCRFPSFSTLILTTALSGQVTQTH